MFVLLEIDENMKMAAAKALAELAKTCSRYCKLAYK